MSSKNFLAKAKQHLVVGTSLFALLVNLGAPVTSVAQETEHDKKSHTESPIKHVIVIIGENRTFDHVFATYQPKHGKAFRTCCGRVSSMGTALPAPTFLWPASLPPAIPAPT